VWLKRGDDCLTVDEGVTQYDLQICSVIAVLTWVMAVEAGYMKQLFCFEAS
jgi:hypothetical protein